jgi:pyrroline-5-carboxylate reductase
MRTGIIGTGHLAGFLVEGCRRTGAPFSFVVSPRGAQNAATLRERFSVEVASSNQDVVDRSQLVIVCVRPTDAHAVLAPLTFRAGQTVLSLMAGVSHADLKLLADPAMPAVAMMPGHANALGHGPAVLYPVDDVAIGFLSHFGSLHVMDDWPSYAVASVIAGLSGTSMGLMIELIRWYEAAGLEARLARSLVTETIIANAEVLRRSLEQPDALLAGLQTPGGTTEQGLGILRDRGAFDAFREMMDTIARRMGAKT